MQALAEIADLLDGVNRGIAQDRAAPFGLLLRRSEANAVTVSFGAP